MSASSAVPIVILAPVRDPIDAVNAVLRRAGHTTHCTWIPAVRDLADALTQLNPELLVCMPRDAAEPLAVARTRDQVAPIVPLLLLADACDEAAISEAMKLGARDVVSLAHPARLQAVITRELRSFRLERALNATLQSSRAYRRQLESVLQQSTDAIAHIQEGIVVEANAAWVALFGASDATALVGQPVMDLFLEQSHTALKGALAACLQGRWGEQTLEAAARRADGSQMPLEFALAAGEHDNEPGVRLIVRARPRDEQALARDLADSVRRDPATGFLQRAPLLEALGRQLSQPAAGGVRYIAVIKLDKFALIERELGATASEQLIADFAALLKNHCTGKDVLGRLGGTTFLALLERGNSHDVAAWADQFVDKVGKYTFKVANRTMTASCSVGLSLVPHSSAHPDTAIAEALDALRRARGLGGNRCASGVHADTDQRVQAYDKVWVAQIKSGLIENRFRLVQQPIASVRGDDPQMFDVLVRMVDRAGKEVLPSEFMPAAERNDLLKNIDRWVIGAALALAAQRQPACLFVRLSKDSVLDGTLPTWLESQIAAHRVQPERICFQVTEELAASYLTHVTALSKLLRDHRLRFALERFGAGRQPEALLEAIPLDFVKIDGALMQGLATGKVLQQKVRALITAASQRKIATIAERVEDANTMAVLWQLGVQFVQGYFVREPEQVVI